MSEKQRFTTVKILSADWKLLRTLAAMQDRKQFDIIQRAVRAYAKANGMKVPK